ncbi:MAG TPA: hypothetical protein VET26_08745 [Candidatus Sulfotelmatobacter sp.]|nr:hypothetical protein [Candidatus Sulfotelmatobacter sp.]
MNWSVLRREWGAVTFVLTVVVGAIIVPVALYFTNQGPAPIATPTISTASSPRASGVETASAARTSPSPSASASP